MTYGAQKDKEFPRLLCPRNNFLFLRAQRNGRVPHGLTPHRGKCIVLLYPSEHRCPILSTLSEPLSKQLVSVLEPGPLSVPLRDTHGHYGEVTLSIADTSRLMDAGTTLEKLGHELGLPKIDIEGKGNDKSRMDELLGQSSALFESYAMRDCEIALAWLISCARTQQEVLHMDRLSPTTG